ncbi:MAG: DUF493 family protein [Victivallaceae bacterium]|nr:DUF493 family protein [Victivallaceae bacterium]
MSTLSIPGGGKPSEVQFPAPWEFRIIVVAAEADAAAPKIAALLSRFGTPSPLRKTEASKTGKYQTLFTSMTMPDRASLDAIAKELAVIPGVKMVL